MMPDAGLRRGRRKSLATTLQAQPNVHLVVSHWMRGVGVRTSAIRFCTVPCGLLCNITCSRRLIEVAESIGSTIAQMSEIN